MRMQDVQLSQTTIYSSPAIWSITKKQNRTNLLSKIACAVWWVQDLIIENWEVKGKTQPYGVSWSQLSQSNVL